MRKFLFFGSVLLLFLFLAFPVLCQQSQEGFEDKTQEAKKEALDKRENILIERDACIQGAVEDGEINEPDMESLKYYAQRLKDFDKNFKQVYGDQPQTDAELNKAIDEYFSRLWRRDKKGIVQAFFASRTGHDVRISNSFSELAEGLIFFALLLIAVGAIVLVVAAKNNDWRGALLVLTFWVVAVLLFLVVIFV